MKFSKKSWGSILTFFITYCILGSSLSYAEILLQDNFDKPSPSEWECGDGPYGSWTGISGATKSSCTIGTSLNGEKVIASTIESPGMGNSGKSYRINRANGFEVGYVGNLSFDPSTKKYPIRKVHHRFYLKIPEGWDYYSPASETKLSRYYLRETNSGGFLDAPSDQIRVSWYGKNKDSAYIRTYWSMNDLFNNKISGWYTFPKKVYLSDYDDGKWHCWEYMLDIQANQIVLQLWVDGVSKGQIVRPGSYQSSNTTIRALGGLGWGNLTNGSWEFPSNNQFALEYDDFVVSTNYIGPGGSSSSSSTSSSSGSKSSTAPPPPGKPRILE